MYLQLIIFLEIKTTVNVKGFVPRSIRSNASYKFGCVRCTPVNAGESSQHFPMRDKLKMAKNAYIYKPRFTEKSSMMYILRTSSNK